MHLVDVSHAQCEPCSQCEPQQPQKQMQPQKQLQLPYQPQQCRSVMPAAAVGAAVVLIFVVIPLAVLLALQVRATAPYVEIGRAFRAGGVPAMAETAKTHLPQLQRDLALFTRQ